MNAAKIITVEKSRFLENQANDGGLSFEEMMENAGRMTAEAIRRRTEVRDNRIVILVGPGNNGGDGLVAAYYLREMGARVSCYVWKRDAEGDANFARVQEGGIPVVWADDDDGFQALHGLLSGAHAIVDALLGVGVCRPIDGQLKELLNATRQAVAERRHSSLLAESVPPGQSSSLPTIIAIDCPSGLDCDTGGLDPAALNANVTVTFAHPKAGLLRFPGAEAVGEIVVADIGIPPGLASDVPLELATPELVRGWLPERSQSGHKGTFGRLLLVAGSVNYVGAAILAGAGAKRSGVGLVTMALPMPIQPSVAASLVEATYLLLPHDMGVINSGAVQVLQKELEAFDALLLGPGITQEKEAIAFVHSFLGLKTEERRGQIGFLTSASPDERERPSLPPLIIDADGLNALASANDWWTGLSKGTILTPHPGEMARLMGDSVSIQDVQADREGVARNMAAKWKCTVVLKGAHTVVAEPSGRVIVLPFANAGLATAGTGDVLAGAIAGLRAQGMAALEASVSGAYIHGLAGELARADLGDMGVVAGDLAPRLPLALRRLR